ncbi:MAG: penicillin acylase family protein [Sphingomonadales bacterium]|nr:penicillin acylase family protein [Sphingomonadales bacterium]
MRSFARFAALSLIVLATPAAARDYRAAIVRDEWGIAHVSGKTDADAVYGMITAQAEDDFPRIEDNYLTNLGRKAEADGEGALWQDLRQRLWIDPVRLHADYARSPAWLRALMDAWAAGLNAYGAVTWGQFFIYQGFNARAGWMHTSSGIDNVDQFAETIVTRHGRRFARHLGKLEPIAEHAVTLRFRRPDGTLATCRFTTYATRHGPVVGAENSRWLAQALMNRPVAALQQSYLRTKAHTLAEFLKVANLKANSSNNTLFADSRGEIAYLHPQFVPVRNDRLDWRAPVDGTTADWHGLHALATLPQAINPHSGWAYNTNNAPWTAAGADSPNPANYPRYMDQIGANPRGPHAERLLAETSQFTLDSLITAAYDPWLPEFERLVPQLAAAHARHPAPARDAAVALLTQWDKRWSLDSTATTLAVFWGDALLGIGKPEIADSRLTRWQWLDRSSDAQKLAALDTAVARLTADFGTWQVPWGDVNRYQRNDGAIAQTFDDTKPSAPIAFPASQWGSLAAFGAEHYPGTKRLYGTRGNSFVAAVEFGVKVRARAVSIGGESSDPASPHFADQITRYATGDLREVHYYPDDIAAHAHSRETVTSARQAANPAQ